MAFTVNECISGSFNEFVDKYSKSMCVDIIYGDVHNDRWG